MKEIKTVLVANRGVVAKRIMQTCKEMELFTIGIYTRHDADMRFNPFAGEIFQIDDIPGSNGYMNKEKLVELAIEHQAAIHPGYGFLSENEAFARMCQSAEIKFIGPSPEVLHIAGNKIVCHELLLKNNIPVIPSFSYTSSNSTIRQRAAEIGYPLMVKPAHGGGGIGMQIVNNESELENILHDASLLAKQYFGDAALLVEKYLPKAKHIEVQLIADQHGDIEHLFERECSMQRRNQKVIEEGPSPALDDALREQLYQLAVKIGKIIYLDNIATIEFLFYENNFYFLEVNPRLQVEHAVTEELTGIDLVEWQIRIANGESIEPIKKYQKINGHCIEARIYAEDPLTGLPSPGNIEYISLPDGKGIRIESAIWQGAKIPETFDPLLLKLIAYAENREQCRLKMIMALQNLDINGTVRVNTMAILQGLKSESFIQGNYNTNSFESLDFFDNVNIWQKELAGILAKVINTKEKENSRPLSSNNNINNYWKPGFWQKR